MRTPFVISSDPSASADCRASTQAEPLLEGLRPSVQTVALFKDLFFKAWDECTSRTEEIAKSLRDELRKNEQQIEQLLDRIVESSTPSVIAVYERRIAKPEKDKLIIIEKPQANAAPKRGSADQLELAFRFLENPHELWVSDRLDDKRLVLKLTFANRLAYCRKSGFRTPQTTLPFKALEAVQGGKCKMAVDAVASEPVSAGGAAKNRENSAVSALEAPEKPLISAGNCAFWRKFPVSGTGKVESLIRDRRKRSGIAHLRNRERSRPSFAQ